MMPQDAKKKMVAVILEKMSGEMSKKPRSEEGIEKDVPENDYAVAAEEVMSAFKAEDAKMLGRALKGFVELCMYAEEDESEVEVEDPNEPDW